MYKFQDHWYEEGERLIYLPNPDGFGEIHGDLPRIYLSIGRFQSDLDVSATCEADGYDMNRFTRLKKERCVPWSEEMWLKVNKLYSDREIYMSDFHDKLKKVKQGKI